MAAVLGGTTLAAGVLAWGVRGRASTLLAPSIWRGPATRRAIALTFDDGPSESTPEILDLLEKYSARATFFQCGFHVRRLPDIARQVLAAGHEIGNHTDTHAPLYLQSAAFIGEQVSRAQDAIATATGHAPRYFRAPYGARWFGLREVQHRHRLIGVMWTTIARDWALPAPRIVTRLRDATAPGAILCLHDGRVLAERPNIGNTIAALAGLLPVWRDAGYEICTVSQLFPPLLPGDSRAR